MNLTYVAVFLAGAFLCNGVPHLSAGLQGQSFPTPFARLSAAGRLPLVNFLWGAVNLTAGITLLVRNHVTLGLNPRCYALAAGVLVMGAWLSYYFGKVRAAK